jgi:hypothetical protein
MKAFIGTAMFVMLTVISFGSVAARAQAPGDEPNDNMTPYRKLATATLTAFKAHDMATAKQKARDLEVGWDNGEKALQKKSPDVWAQIDKAMDAFIKPLQGKSPDPAKVQAAYDAFISKLQLAAKSDGDSKR